MLLYRVLNIYSKIKDMNIKILDIFYKTIKILHIYNKTKKNISDTAKSSISII